MLLLRVHHKTPVQALREAFVVSGYGSVLV